MPKHACSASLLFIAITFLNVVFSLQTSTRGQTYRRCPMGYLYLGSSLGNNNNDSPLFECLLTCSDMPECLSINVCFLETPQTVASLVVCNFMAGAVSDMELCTGLAGNALPSCFNVIKYPVTEEATTAVSPVMTSPMTTAVTEMTTSGLTCENGGRPLNETCVCPVQFVGAFCERLPQDCTEMFEYGARDVDDGNYVIEPFNSSSIGVVCGFSTLAATVTVVMSWWSGSILDLPNRPLSQLTMATLASDGSFFVGLHGLHSLLQQKAYQLNVEVTVLDKLVEIQALASYTNFDMQDEASSFAITYSSFSSPNQAANGWPITPSFFFSKERNDTCAVTSDTDGWLSVGCSALAKLFNTPQPEWPVLSLGPLPLTAVKFTLQPMMYY